MPELRRRLSAVEKQIININSADVRIKIMGTVIGIGERSLVLDDGTGKIDIVFDDLPSYLIPGQIIKIIARISPLAEGFECQGECIQQLDSNFDIRLYKLAKEIVSRK
jgi:hypothetical protein